MTLIDKRILKLERLNGVGAEAERYERLDAHNLEMLKDSNSLHLKKGEPISDSGAAMMGYPRFIEALLSPARKKEWADYKEENGIIPPDLSEADELKVQEQFVKSFGPTMKRVQELKQKRESG